MVYKAARGPRHWLVEIAEATLEIPSVAFYTFSPGADGYCEIKGKPQGTVAPDDRDPGVTPRERQFVTPPLGLPPLGSGISGGWHEPDASEAWQYVASE